MKMDANAILQNGGPDVLRAAFDAGARRANGSHVNHSDDPHADVPPVGEFAPGANFKPEPDSIIIRRCADIPQKPIRWLKRDFLAIGKITLLGGNPGMGKSQIAAYAASRITRSAPWQDGTRSDKGSVVFFSAEDSFEDTINPRLDFAGADRNRCIAAESVNRGGKPGSFCLKKDLDLLSRLMLTTGDVRLVTMDPVTAYMGDIDSHRTTDVRAVLEPLARFAEQCQVALLLITHPPKGAQTSAINSFTGSLAYAAASRLAFVAVEEAETERKLLLPVKNNLGPLPAGIGYSIEGGASSAGVNTSRVIWDNLPVTMTANEAVAASTKQGDRGGAKREAEDFLKTELATGPRDAGEMRDKAVALGIASKTLQRARTDLNIVAEKHGYQGVWTWRLP